MGYTPKHARPASLKDAAFTSHLKPDLYTWEYSCLSGSSLVRRVVLAVSFPALRSQGAGRIINIGSSAGFSASAGRGLYGAAKAAVELITEALHAELAPLGIHVTVVEPGSFRTEFLTTDSRRQPEKNIADYDATVGKLRDAIEAGNGHQPGDPVKAAAAIRQLAAAPGPPLRLQLGSDCVTLVEDKLTAVSSELARWRDLALSTDYTSA